MPVSQLLNEGNDSFRRSVAKVGEKKEKARRHAHVVRPDGTGGRYFYQLVTVLFRQAAETAVLSTDDQRQPTVQVGLRQLDLPLLIGADSPEAGLLQTTKRGRQVADQPAPWDR